MQSDPLHWFSKLPLPSSLEYAARSALDEGRREFGRSSDQLLQAIFRSASPAWPRAGAARVDAIRREVEARIASLEADGSLERPAEFHPEPDPADVRVVRRTLGLPGVTPRGVEELEFWSEFRGANERPGGERWARHEQNRRARAWMLAHRELDRPWIVCLHGFGMGTPAVDPAVFRAGGLHEELGVNVAGLVLPLHGERAGDSLGPRELIQTSPLDMLHGLAQSAWDARRLIGWLRSLGAERIAVHGFSLGGASAALLAGLDSELAGVVAGAPSIDIVDSYRSAAAVEPGGPIPARSDAIWERLDTLFSVVHPTSMPPLLEPDRLGLYAGMVDQLVSSESTAGLAAHWRHPKSHWYGGGHVGLVLERSVHEFVDARLAAFLLD